MQTTAVTGRDSNMQKLIPCRRTRAGQPQGFPSSSDTKRLAQSIAFPPATIAARLKKEPASASVPTVAAPTRRVIHALNHNARHSRKNCITVI